MINLAVVVISYVLYMVTKQSIFTVILTASFLYWVYTFAIPHVKEYNKKHRNDKKK